MSRLASVLLIDPDPKGLATLTFGFVREGARVMGATTYLDGIDRAQAEPHEVVVVALRSDAAGTREILEELAERDGKPVPLVALGTEEHRLLVGGMPSADFMPMPSFIRDIITTAKLRAALRPEADAGTPTTVQGPLSDFGVFSIVRSMQATRRSAIIQLERADRKGELRFTKGDLTYAQVGSHQGAGALNMLLLWEEAALSAQFKTIAKRGQMSLKGKDLIEQAERFMRDFSAAARSLGSATTVFQTAEGHAAGSGNDDTPAETLPVLRLFDGKRTLADVIDDSPFQVFDTLRIVNRFVDSKVLVEGSESPSRGGLGVRSPLLDEWLRTPGDDEFVRPVGEATIIQRPDPVPADTEKEPTVKGPVIRPPAAGADVRKRVGSKTQPMTTLSALAAQDTPKEGAKEDPAPVAAPVSAQAPTPQPAATSASGQLGSSASGQLGKSASGQRGGSASGQLGGSASGQLKSGFLKPSSASPPAAISAGPSVVVSIPVEEQPAAAAPAPAPAPAPVPVDTAKTDEDDLGKTKPYGGPGVGVLTNPDTVARQDRVLPSRQVEQPAESAPVKPSEPARSGVVSGAQSAAPSGSIVTGRAKDNARSAQPSGGSSIQIDADMLADMDNFEMKNAPSTPHPVATPAAESQPAALADRPRARTQTQDGIARTRKNSPERARRPSGEFDALEKDFFDREADLYKQETVEDFSDLDHKPGRRK